VREQSIREVMFALDVIVAARLARARSLVSLLESPRV
jgi:hypothetical protein